MNPSVWRLRLEAWWHGYDAEEYSAWRAGNGATAESSDGLSIDLPELPSLDFDDVPPQDPLWPSARIDVAERLFGPGYTVPGGAEEVVELVKPMALTPVHSFLDLSAGMGGPGAALVQRYGVWVTGYEPNAALASTAETRLPTLKGGDQVSVRHYDPESISLRSKSFDAILSQDAMHRVQDKNRLLAQVHDILKDWGQFVMTDYVLTKGDGPSPHARRWIDTLPPPVALWTKDVYETALADLGFDIRIVEDRSASHAELIRKAFSQFLKKPGSEGLTSQPAEVAQALMREAEDWARRAALLASGEIALYRFFVIKPGDDSNG